MAPFAGIAAGRIPSTVEGTDVQADGLVGIRPNGRTGGDDPFYRLAQHSGEALGEPSRFTKATRNPFNREQYQIRVYRLHDCERARLFPYPLPLHFVQRL
jgi:hypothetical protein